MPRARDGGQVSAATPAPGRKGSVGSKGAAKAGDSRPATPMTPAITAAAPRNQSGASRSATDCASVEPKARMTRSRSRSVGMAGMANGMAAEVPAAAAGQDLRRRQSSASVAAAAGEPEVVDLCGTSSDRGDSGAKPSLEASDSEDAVESDDDGPIVREVPFR